MVQIWLALCLYLISFVDRSYSFLLSLKTRTSSASNIHLSIYHPYSRHLSSTKLSSNVESTDIITSSDLDSKQLQRKVSNNVKLMYKFSRPHTIKGTILASFMGVTRALIENPGRLSLELVPRALLGLTALLCGNAYIVGINQIYDVKIDEVGLKMRRL
jgi:hypothetical protein